METEYGIEYWEGGGGQLYFPIGKSKTKARLLTLRQLHYLKETPITSI
jgi:hypothetical protein